MIAEIIVLSILVAATIPLLVSLYVLMVDLIIKTLKEIKKEKSK